MKFDNKEENLIKKNNYNNFSNEKIICLTKKFKEDQIFKIKNKPSDLTKK